MWQIDPHFLFPQIYFGHPQDMDELLDGQEEEGKIDDSCHLLFDRERVNLNPKIGLYIDWTDDPL